VEQYIEQNVPNGNRTKTVPTIHCHVCKTYKQLYKEFVTAIMSYKVCSLYCWDKLLDLQMIKSPTKCETCTKFINMDTISISPSFYVATEKKAHGFCSATCKNVFVLKTRQIRPCTSCQVRGGIITKLNSYISCIWITISERNCRFSVLTGKEV